MTFEELVNQHLALIRKVSYLYENNREDRKDLEQDILYQLWRAYPKFRGDSKAGTWLYRIALNTAISRIRKKRLPISDLNRQEFSVEEENKEEEEKLEAIRQAMELLNPAEKAILLLYLDDLELQRNCPGDRSKRKQCGSQTASHQRKIEKTG